MEWNKTMKMWFFFFFLRIAFLLFILVNNLLFHTSLLSLIPFEKVWKLFFFWLFVFVWLWTFFYFFRCDAEKKKKRREKLKHAFKSPTLIVESFFNLFLSSEEDPVWSRKFLEIPYLRQTLFPEGFKEISNN